MKNQEIGRCQIALMIMIVLSCRIICADDFTGTICRTNKHDNCTRTSEIYLHNGQTNLVHIVDYNFFKDEQTNMIQYIFFHKNIKVATYYDLHLPFGDGVTINTYPGAPYTTVVKLRRDGRVEAVGIGGIEEGEDFKGQSIFDFVNGAFAPRRIPEKVK